MLPRSIGFIVAAAQLLAGSASAQVDNSWRERAVQVIADEPTVVEAMFPNDAPNSFWASMRDDGSRRDGFAEYLCLVMHQHGMPKGKLVVIRIWDAAAMAKSDMREIGKFNCMLQ